MPRSGNLSIVMENIPEVGFYGLKIEFFVYKADATTLIAHYFHTLNPYYPNRIDYPLLLETGDYYVKIKADDNFSSSSIAFNTSFNLDTTDLCECNNKFASACLVPLNTVFNEKIYGYNLTDTAEGNVNGVDVDFYKIIMPSYGTLSVNISDIPNVGFYGLKLEFFIFKPDSTLVAHYYHTLNPYYPNNIIYPVLLTAGTYYVKIKTDDYSQSSIAFKTSFNFSGVLPLNLLSFDILHSNAGNKLLWTTTYEMNTALFIIENSSNGRDFTALATIAANNISFSTRTYQYVDQNRSNGPIYYRLKMIDMNGGFTYSKILMLNNIQYSPITIYPNPAKNYLNVQLADESAKTLVIKVCDANGRLLLLKNWTLVNGQQIINLDVSTLTPGYYVLMIEGKNRYRKIFIKE